MTAGEDLTPNPSPKERGTKNSNIIEYVIPTAEVSQFSLKVTEIKFYFVVITNWEHLKSELKKLVNQ
jgi:hypothetical protein